MNRSLEEERYKGEVEDEIIDNLVDVMANYRNFFGKEKTARLLMRNIEYLFEEEFNETYEFIEAKSSSLDRLSEISFNDMVSHLRMRFMFPGVIPFGSKVYIPDYGICKVIHISWGSVSFITNDGYIESSDIAFPINHEIALKEDIEIEEDCLVIYNGEVWKIVFCSIDNNILESQLDIVSVEENSIFFKDKRLESVTLKKILIPTFVTNLDGRKTAFSNSGFLD